MGPPSRPERSVRWRRRSCAVDLPAGEQAPEWTGDVGPRRAEAVGEPLLEPDMLDVAEATVRLERRRVVRADVEDDLVARPKQIRRHGAGDGGGEAPASIVDVRQDVPDDG